MGNLKIIESVELKDSTDYIKKARGKSIPIRITEDTRKRVRSFRNRLQEMSDNDEVRDIDKKTISYILSELDDYELNILFAYYDISNCSPTILGKILGVSSSVITNKLKKIHEKIRKAVCT